MQDIALVSKNQRQKERNKHSNNSFKERLRTHQAHIRSFDNQTSTTCKVLHLSVKTETERKEKTPYLLNN